MKKFEEMLVRDVVNEKYPYFTYQNVIIGYDKDDTTGVAYFGLIDDSDIVIPLLSWMPVATVVEGMIEAAKAVGIGADAEPETEPSVEEKSEPKVEEKSEEKAEPSVDEVIENPIMGAVLDGMTEILDKLLPQEKGVDLNKTFNHKSIMKACSKVEHSKICEYVKIQITEDISLRYIIRFDDRPTYVKKWFMKLHKDRAWSPIDDKMVDNMVTSSKIDTIHHMYGYSTKAGRFKIVSTIQKNGNATSELIKE